MSHSGIFSNFICGLKLLTDGIRWKQDTLTFTFCKSLQTNQFKNIEILKM